MASARPKHVAWYRNDSFQIVPSTGMTFRHTIRVATPMRCDSAVAKIWDVSLGAEIPSDAKVPAGGGEFQVSLYACSL